MSVQATTEDTANVLDIIKQIISILLVVAGMAAFYYFPEILLLYRVLALVVIVASAIGLFFTTAAGQNIWVFMLEAKLEVRKVVWPTREETIRTTLLVFGMVFLVGLGLWLLDMFLFWGIRLLTEQG
ncbi:MAG: preprotein translocase subunit SecE [Methylococcales bacterium]|nr:preprotein translocase subunit SecE [Methylococcales bacterium]